MKASACRPPTDVTQKAAKQAAGAGFSSTLQPGGSEDFSDLFTAVFSPLVVVTAEENRDFYIHEGTKASVLPGCI